MHVERRNQPSSTASLLGGVHHSMASLAMMLGSAKSATLEYGQSLANYTARIPANEGDGILHSIARGILQVTVKMTQRHNELGERLDEASVHVTELGRFLEHARKEALTDSLTGLANRKAFDKRLAHDMAEAAAQGMPLTLLLIDIDHFKKINDTYGHVTGDQVLRLISSVLLNNIKGQDMGARYGGEEFAVLLPRTPLAGGQNVAEVLRRLIEGKEIVNRGSGHKLGRITLSAGVAQYKPGESTFAFIERADAALYEAKKSGRNRVCAG